MPEVEGVKELKRAALEIKRWLETRGHGVIFRVTHSPRDVAIEWSRDGHWKAIVTLSFQGLPDIHYSMGQDLPPNFDVAAFERLLSMFAEASGRKLRKWQR